MLTLLKMCDLSLCLSGCLPSPLVTLAQGVSSKVSISHLRTPGSSHYLLLLSGTRFYDVASHQNLPNKLHFCIFIFYLNKFSSFLPTDLSLSSLNAWMLYCVCFCCHSISIYNHILLAHTAYRGRVWGCDPAVLIHNTRELLYKNLFSFFSQKGNIELYWPARCDKCSPFIVETIWRTVVFHKSLSLRPNILCNSGGKLSEKV